MTLTAIQITVAWAGEQIAGPIVKETGSSAPQASRLGWWRTELTDPDAGGDFLKRLLPRTHAWAALAAVREAARRVDEKARRRHATPDALWSLFHFGFAWDERLDARLAEHRRGDAPPGAVLSAALPLAGGFDRSSFVAWAAGLSRDTASDVVPGGRRLRGRPASRTDGARRLATVLAPLRAEPLPAEYPLPFFPMGAP